MKKRFLQLAFISLFGSISVTAQSKCQQDAEKFQKDLDETYSDPKKSPLDKEALAKFSFHPFYEYDDRFCVVAFVEKIENPIPFEMPTSSGKTTMYQKYAKLRFSIEGTEYTLFVYQNLDLMKTVEYQNYLFLPFRDLTNSHGTYGGGRYMDLNITGEDSMMLNFNTAYQPYCAYVPLQYSCPIVPEENILPIPIKAGVKYDDKWY